MANRYNRLVGQMLEHVEHKGTDEAEGVMRVPSSNYTDPARWQREMDLVFKRLPVLAGLSVEIPQPGDFKTIDMLGMPLLVTRARDGSVRVMLNVCSHRAMTLTTEPCGHRKLFTCPYHSWSFDGEGNLRGIADAEKFGDVDKSQLGLTQLPAYERGGLIFTVLDPAAQDVDFDAFLGGMIEDIEEKHFDKWYYCGQRTMAGANWKVAYDGYLEGYHFAAAHPETIHPRSYSNIMQFEAFGPHVMIGFPQRSIDKLREVPEEQWWQHENDGYDFVRTIFPNVSIFVAPEITSVSQLIPGPTVNENRTIVYFLHKEHPADEQGAAELTQMVDWLAGVIDREDYQVGLQVQRGLESGAHREVVFGRNERGNQYFHRWLEYYLADDPDAPVPQL
ncbi:aromatic ring-hydroxylating oxygenase subunit alpha [Haliea sp. E17]|uniref:aromatic ring-hydroxylating oxygenase subunit alpha n=1 Tax=Haliea sp. E17 TaxID=3401576 RepID=UPI003AAFF627